MVSDERSETSGHRLAAARRSISESDLAVHPGCLDRFRFPYDGDLVGSNVHEERMLLSYGAWLDAVQAGRIENLTERAAGLAVIELATGDQCVLFGFSGDRTRATIGKIGGDEGDLAETDVWALVPHREFTGDSYRPASSRWAEGDGRSLSWLLLHKGYANPGRYGHLRSDHSDE